MRRLIKLYKNLLTDRDFFKLILPVAVPIALQNLLSSLTGLGAALMVGQLGDAALAGVSLAGQIQFLLTLACFGIASGAAIFSARFWGEGNRAGVQKTQGLTLVLTISLSLVFTLLGLFLPRQLVGLFTPDPAVQEAGASFLRVSCLSFPFFAAGMSYAVILRTVGDTKTPLFLSGFSLVLQLGLGLVLILGIPGLVPSLGVPGAALAQLAARVVETLAYIVLVRRLNRPNAGSWSQIFSFDRKLTARYLHVALPVVLNEVLWATGMSAIKAIYGWIGSRELAACAMVDNFAMVLFIVFFGTGNGSAVVIGHAIGRKDLVAAKHLARQTALFAPLLGAGAGIILAVSSPFLPQLFQVTGGVRDLALVLFLVYALLLPGKAFYHDMIVGVLRSGGDTRFSLFMDQLGVWLWAIPLGLVFAFVLHLPFPLVFLLINLEEPLKSLLSLWRLKSGRWLHPVTAGEVHEP